MNVALGCKWFKLDKPLRTLCCVLWHLGSTYYSSGKLAGIYFHCYQKGTTYFMISPCCIHYHTGSLCFLYTDLVIHVFRTPNMWPQLWFSCGSYTSRYCVTIYCRRITEDWVLSGRQKQNSRILYLAAVKVFYPELSLSSCVVTCLVSKTFRPLRGNEVESPWPLGCEWTPIRTLLLGLFH